MKSLSDKEEIIDSIRKGLKNALFKEINQTEFDNSKIYQTPSKPLIDIFKDELTRINGEFIYCENNGQIVEAIKTIHQKYNLALCYSPDPRFKYVVDNLKIDYTEKFEKTDEIKSGISACEFLVARFGSVVVSSALPGGRRIFSFPEIHIVIASESQLVMELEEALNGLRLRYGTGLPSQIINIAGPSRTADIEKTLILGAHGPKMLFVIVNKNEIGNQ